MKKGFTLVELAIVLVIIGLLVGGVLAGQELVKQSQIKKIITSVENLKLSYNTFQLKYSCFPGDCNDAVSFLGGSTINGNGDGEITPANINGTNIIFENLLFFEHIGLAGLYKNYSQNPSSQNPSCYYNAQIFDVAKFFSDCNYPIPAMNATLFAYAYSDFYNLTYSNLPFACINTTVGCLASNNKSSITVEDIRSLDISIDDGKPLKGRVLSACTSEINDFTNYNTANREAAYDMSLQSCPIIIKF